MDFREWLENWDAVGTGATAEDEVYAQEKLRDALRKVVKDPYARYKENQIYMGTVADFFPRADARMKDVCVFWNPKLDAAAQLHHNGRYGTIWVGKFAYKHQGTSGSLGASFIHEVEHLHDLLHQSFRSDQTLSEFTPRLRQMLRQIRDQPNFRIWNYVGRHGRDHAESLVDHYLDALYGGYKNQHTPTPEEREFAVQAVLKRAKEIFDRMTFDSP